LGGRGILPLEFLDEEGMSWGLVLRHSDGRELEVCDIGEVAAPVELRQLGMDRAAAQGIMAAVQRQIVGLQEAELATAARAHARAVPGSEVKDYRVRKIHTLFGTAVIKVPRLRYEGQTQNFVTWPCSSRATPELDYMRVKLAAWMSFPRAMSLLREVCPVDGGVAVGTAHNRVRDFAWKECEAASDPVPETSEVVLPIDTTFVKGLPGLAEKSLEIMVGAAEANRGEHTYFASPITMQSQCKRLGGEALDRVGRSPDTNLIAFTDGGGNVQRLARELGATEDPITDWFHISMRIRHVEAVASAFRAQTRPMEASRTSIIRKVERLRWRLWHGKSGAISRTRSELIMDLRTYRGDPDQAGWKRSGSKLRQSIDKLEDYVTSSKTRMIDYGARQSSGRRVSTSLVEGGADFIVNARMGRKQHMRWSSRGAFQILQARTADINGLLEGHFLAA
jgi:hypothetical protein